jgi:Flp pilus assembly protein TadG
MSRRGGKGFWLNESGATAALYALALPALVAVAGVGFDYAHVAAMDTELQNAADQAALAGATQLDKQTGAIARATSAAQGGLVANQTLFANDGDTRNVDVFAVTFYATQGNAELCGATGVINPAAAGADALAAFVCVTVETRTANYALTPIVGAFSGALAAQAAAGVGSALCRTPPLMICNPSEPTSGDANADFNANAYIGYGLLAKGGAGSSWAPGNFGYVDTFPGPGGGTPDLLKAFAWDTTPGTCISQSGNTTVDSEPGNHASVADAVNVRFDIYNGNAGGNCPTGGTCPASRNSMKDVVHAPDFAPPPNGACGLTNNGAGWEWPAGAYQPSSTSVPLLPGATPTVMGHPRDMCHAVSENGSCIGGPFGNGLWDRNAYFRTHYAAWTNGDGTSRWQSNTGLSASATRYQVYRWEIDHVGQTIDGAVVLGSKAVGTQANYGQPQCGNTDGRAFGTGTVPTATTADRRRLSVAVVNCVGNNVRGNSTGVPVRRWIDVFLVQPMLDRGGGGNFRSRKDQLYVEIIGETTTGSAGETAGSVVRREVPYLLK